MLDPVGFEGLRGDEGFANTAKGAPVGDRQGEVCVFCGALHVDPVEVDEEEIARSRSHEDEWCAAGGIANRREQACEGLKAVAVR
jgi:hypothetical protein